MMVEIIFMVVCIGLIIFAYRRIDAFFSSGMTVEQIEELGKWLQEKGYKRMEDVNGFAYFENVYRFNPDFTPLRRVFDEVEIRLRSRSRQFPDVVGSKRNGGDEEGAISPEQNSAVVDECSPPPAGVKPTRAEPPFPIRQGEPCNPWLVLMMQGRNKNDR